MKTTATIISLASFFKDSTYSVRIELNEDSIANFMYNEAGERVETKGRHLYMPVKVLLKQLCVADVRFANWFSARRDQFVGKNQHPFAPSVAELFLVNASIDIEETLHKAGEEYETPNGEKGTYKLDVYTHNIVGISFSTDIDSALNKFIPRDRSAIIADLI